MPKILGIDLSASENKETGICVLNGKLEAKVFSLFKDEKILEFAEKISPNLIAIDAPLTFPKKRKSPFREGEREILKLGIKIFPLNFKSMRNLTKRGNNLFRILKRKFKVIEVFPHATKEILDILATNNKTLEKEISRKLKIKILKKNPTIHELDAIISAYTGYLFLKNRTISLGKKSEGQIAIPKREVKFLNLKIDLSKKVFFPRKETEFWVKKVIEKIKKEKKRKEKIKILDIFAGSGCIGISLLKYLKNSFVDFLDIDPNAISQIKKNLLLNKISSKRYKIFKSNIFSSLPKKELYDFIFANPPYVAKERIFAVQERVKKLEPKISWYGGKEGLFFIKKFLKEAKFYLKEGGKIFLEIDPFQKDKIIQILKQQKYKFFKFYKDQFKKIRLVEISK